MVENVKPFMNIGPGEAIREELEIRNWQQGDLAEVLGMSKKFVNELIMSKKPITVETARLLSKAFGQSPQYWLNFDIMYRLREKHDTDRAKEVEEKAKIFKYMPVKEMVKKGWFKPYTTLKELKRQVLSFWNIKSLDFSFMEDVELPGFKPVDLSLNYNKYYALCWYEMAKKNAKNFRTGNYDTDKLKELAENFHSFLIKESGVEEFISELGETGIKFFVLRHLKKAFIDGASFYDSYNPVIVYACRHDRIDMFWFTMAHEISHILLHLNKENYFLDNLELLETEMQQEAKDLAVKMLKVEEIMNYFKTREYQSYISEPRVVYCKEELQLDSAIIAGVLQHYGKMSKKNLNRFKKSVSNLIPEKFFVEGKTFISANR